MDEQAWMLRETGLEAMDEQAWRLRGTGLEAMDEWRKIGMKSVTDRCCE